MKQRLLGFVKREPVLLVSALLALVSACFAPPSAAYLQYIDFRTLGILFCLMAAVAGLSGAGVFVVAARRLSARARHVKSLSLFLALLCFLSAMLITNDVALITFVPLTLLLLEGLEQRHRIFVVVMETVAANLGSMLTPVGNPQNLYLYARYGIGAGEFFAVTAPAWAAGLLLTVLAVGLSRLPRTPVPYLPASGPISRRTALFYGAVFLLSLLAVFRLLPWWLVLGATVAAVAVADRRLFRSIDYSLFATFVFFFILVGNLGSLPVVRDILSRLLVGRELPVSILASQAVSNVPAALLLSGFTENWKPLLVGVNIGGLGTLVASMASLISLRLYARAPGARGGRYFLVFTAVNAVFLLVLGGGALLLL